MSATILSYDALRQVLADPQRKPIGQMVREVAALWLTKGERPGHYIKSFLYRRYVANPSGFLTQAECAALWRYFLDSEADRVLTNKVTFHRHFSGVEGVRLPRHLGHTDGARFVDAAGDERLLRSSDDLDEVVGDLLDQVRVSGGNAVFAKPIDDQGGRGAFLISSAAAPDRLRSAMEGRGYVFQQAVEQHPAMAAVMPDALNALRLTTIRLPGHAARLGSAWLKMGRAGNVTDNPRGMLISSVDPERGRLADIARTKFDVGGNTYTHHPDTGHAVSGLVIPMWEEAADMVRVAAEHTDYPVVGWDVGIATDGPVIIEGNVNSGYHIDEIAHGRGYLDHADFGPFFRELLGSLRQGVRVSETAHVANDRESGYATPNPVLL